MTTIDYFRKMLLARLEVLSNHKGFLWIFIGLFLVLGLIFTKLLSFPPYHDERHFLENIIFFSNSPFIEAVLDYPEVTPPLFYLVYGFWGKIGSFDLVWLRVLSVLLCLFSLLILGRISKDIWPKSRSWKVLLLLILFNPYFLGSSFLVYTDILAFFFLILLVYGIKKENFWVIFLASIGGLLTRQYLVFASLAAGLWMTICYLKKREWSYLLGAGLILLSTIPLLILFKLWGGFAPPSGLEKWNPGGQFEFHPVFLSGYLAFIPIYLFPLFLFKPLVLKKWQLFVLVPAIVWYLFFPVQASEVAKDQMGIETIGWAHKVLIQVFGNGMAIQIFLGFFFCLGCLWLAQMLKDFKGRSGLGLFLILGIISFLIIMPLSYQVWEKYLISLIPFFLILVPLTTEAEPQSNTSRDQEK